jgi:hypothetical protein
MAKAIFFLFIVFSFGGILFALVAIPRIHSKWWIGRDIYLFIDEDSGAKKWEAEYAKSKRALWGESWLTQWLWPHPELSGIMARPHWWRRRYYLQIEFIEKPWPVPYFKKDITRITLTYTSEADRDDATLFLKLEKDLARAITQPWHENLFKLHDHRPDRLQMTFEVIPSVRLPARVSAEDMLNGRATTNSGRTDTPSEQLGTSE